MSPWTNARRTKCSPMYYVIIDYRHERRLPKHSRRDIGCSFSSTRNFNQQSQRRLIVIHAKFLSKRCLPNKVKRSEPGIGWRRKGSQSRHSQKRASTPPSTRPTLLLPPMRCTSGTLYLDDHPTSPPCVASRVQQSDSNTSNRFRPSDSNSLRCPAPEPSAPSPGHLFYNSEDHSDMAFIVGQEEWRFPAHSFVLGKTELTLRALLHSAREEPDGNAQSPSSTDTRVKSTEEHRPESFDDVQRSPLVFKLPDMQPDVFEQMLRYIYTGQVTLSSVDSTLRLLHPSRVYHLPQLTSLCLSYLSKHVTPSNVLTILSHLLCPDNHFVDPQVTSGFVSQEEYHHDKDNERNELVLKCFLVVDHHADTVLEGEAFETLEHELMFEVLKRDTLEVSSEAIVFDSIMRWACRACKKQRKALTAENKCLVLGKALFLVRYLVMTPEEFLRGPVSQGVLSKEDKEAFMSRLTGGQLPIPQRWAPWKVTVRRHRPQSLLSVTSPGSDLLSSNTEASVSPTNSIQPVANTNSGKRVGERKKKSMSKKLLNGVGDLVICVIQLLD